MNTSQERKTEGGKDDRDRGSLSKRSESPFYWRTECCGAHVKQKPEGGWFCTWCLSDFKPPER